MMSLDGWKKVPISELHELDQKFDLVMEKPRFRTQWMERTSIKEINFPPSVVQSGMSVSISQMVKTRSVGGNLDAYEMDGIDSDAPFDSEYVDFFDVMDMAAEQSATDQDKSSGKEKAAVERKTAERAAEEAKPPQNEETNTK